MNMVQGLVSSGSLSNIRVLDLTRVWAGPLATRVMGDFGADIIKISDPRVQLLSSNGLNHKLNRNKRNIGIRLDIDEGREILLGLVRKSDVIVENFRPRVMRNLKIDYEVLKTVKPDIIFVSMPGFGVNGPYSEYPAFGTTAEAVAGIPSLIGYGDGVPISTGIAYGDPVSGLNAITLIMAALRMRNKTGHGQFIDIALSASPLCNIGEYVAAYSSSENITSPSGNRSIEYSPQGAFRCRGRDQWIGISVFNDDEWMNLKDLVSDPDLNNIETFSLEQRQDNEEIIEGAIAKWTSRLDVFEAVSLLQENGVRAGTVSSGAQLLEDPHLNDRDFFFDLEEKEYGWKRYDGNSIPGNRIPKSQWSPTNNVGVNSKEILTDLLGYTESFCEALASKEAVYFEE